LAGSTIPGSYIIGGTATISAGSSVVAISGTTYSALPSGAGVVAVEGGKSSVIVENDHVLSNAAGAAGQHKDATPFEGGAAGSRGRLNGVVIATVVVLLVCVVVSSLILGWLPSASKSTCSRLSSVSTSSRRSENIT
jgi:hypothetical protein